MATNQNEEEMKTQELQEIQQQSEQFNGQGSVEEEENNGKDSKMENKEQHNPSSLSKPSIEGASPGKIFVGGLPKDTTDEKFTKHFGKYGKIVDSVIMKHRGTGLPRGFGFITYEDAEVVDAVIADTHTFEGKQVEIKRTIPKGAISGKDFQTKKIFVGGIPASVDEEEFKNFFSKFGEVEENLLMRDHTTGRSRGFGFIGFTTEKAVDDLLIKGNRIEFAGAQVEIKKAEPKKPGNTPSFAPPTKHYGTPKPAIGRGRGRGGFKDHRGSSMDSGPIRYGGRFGSTRAAAADYGVPYPSREYDGGYGGSYPNSGIGSYRGESSLGYSGRYGSSLGRGYGYSEPSDSYYGSYGGAGGPGGSYGGPGGGYGGYGGDAGGYGAGAGGYGGGAGAGGYGGGAGAGGYAGGAGAGGAGYGGSAGGYNARRDYGSGGASGRYHPYGR